MPMATCKLNIKNYFNKLANTHWQNAPQCHLSPDMACDKQ